MRRGMFERKSYFSDNLPDRPLFRGGTVRATFAAMKNRISHIPMKRLLWLLGPALAAAGCAERPAARPTPPAVRIVEVAPASQPLVTEYPGRVEASEEVHLSFQVSGTLRRIAVEEGARVRRGELVAELDPADYALQLKAVEAEYRRIEAEARRVMALYADSVATADAYDKARYGLEQAAARRDHARRQLADTRIAAPFDGRVQRRHCDAPTVVAAGMPVVTLVATAAPEIEIHIPAADYLRPNAFGRFEASFDYLPGRRVALRLLGVSPKANANQLHTVRLGLAEPLDPLPAPGMNVLVSLLREPAASEGISIPAAALFADGASSCVWLFGADSTVHRRAVTVARLRADGSALLGGGLTAGDRIVATGVHRLAEGERVAPLAAPSETNIGGEL